MNLALAFGVVWSAGLAGAIGFLAIYRSPRRYLDRSMSWHLFWTVLSGGLQWASLLVSQASPIPFLIAEIIAVSIVYWRLWLLIISTRRSASREMRRDVD